ncbi:MAG: PIN domain-containing protein [Anaerolineae bacterium]|jgi:predicted nucleic acid-binding protein|nr:PIN domain-containing protein [Anaerolineae bacterium]MDH7472454.1 PIN domain-containing protein [Anaerolineae bacterium]
MYLVDTNIWLERLLDQERSEEVGQFLARIPTEQLLMSDFTLHSIGVILERLGQRAVLTQFVQDVFVDGGVGLVSVRPESMLHLVAVVERFHLDFDDAYQYVAAEQTNAVLVSFDDDFDRTDRGRKTPMEILRMIGDTVE